MRDLLFCSEVLFLLSLGNWRTSATSPGAGARHFPPCCQLVNLPALLDIGFCSSEATLNVFLPWNMFRGNCGPNSSLIWVCREPIIGNHTPGPFSNGASQNFIGSESRDVAFKVATALLPPSLLVRPNDMPAASGESGARDSWEESRTADQLLRNELLASVPFQS